MTSLGNMGDFGPFWVISGSLVDQIWQMTPFSLSTHSHLSDEIVEIAFWQLFKNHVIRVLYWKMTSSKMAQKWSKIFPIDGAFFLVVLGPIRDLCAKFLWRTISVKNNYLLGNFSAVLQKHFGILKTYSLFQNKNSFWKNFIRYSRTKNHSRKTYSLF